VHKLLDLVEGLARARRGVRAGREEESRQEKERGSRHGRRAPSWCAYGLPPPRGFSLTRGWGPGGWRARAFSPLLRCRRGGARCLEGSGWASVGGLSGFSAMGISSVRRSILLWRPPEAVRGSVCLRKTPVPPSCLVSPRPGEPSASSHLGSPWSMKP